MMPVIPADPAVHPASFARAPIEPTRDNSSSAAAKFEVLVFAELMKAMRATVPEDEDGGNFGLEMSQSMFDEAIADASAGGLGLESLLARELGETGTPNRASAPSPLTHRGAAAAYVGHTAASSGPRQRHGTYDSALPKTGDLPTQGVVSSRYGWRHHPTEAVRSFHEGLDIAADEGTEIMAVQAGRVRHAGPRGSYGNLVELEHADGSITRYAHASRVFVRRGDIVEVGEAIADVGATGRATGPHLHFEALVDDKAVDPERYLAGLRDRASTERGSR